MNFSIENKKIAVLMGGPGSERPVSLKSGEGVVGALSSLGAHVVAVDVCSADFEVPDDVWIAFNIIHGTFGEDGQLQRVLEGRGIPYTGEGVAGSELAIDKIKTKQRFAERGVPTAPFEVLNVGEQPTMRVPLVIKAPCEGSSVGVYIVREQDQVAPTLEKAFSAHGSHMLVEKFIAGRELTVGIVGDLVLPIIEIRPKRADEFYDFANKYQFLSPNAAGADHLCPAPISEEHTRLVQDAALAAHRALDLQVYSRVDILLTPEGTPYVLEVNTIPGMTPVSLLPEAAGVAGISYPQLCARIIELSIAARGA